MNRCYAVGKAICKSLRIAPDEACIEAINAPCADAAPGMDTLNNCIDDIKSTSGDSYGACLGGLPSSCVEIWYEMSFGIDSSSSDPNSCYSSYDGVCDEGSGCDYGTDRYDCADSCQYADDGVCDEGSGCDYGTDTTDCGSSSSSTSSSGTSGFTSGCTETADDESVESIVSGCVSDPTSCSTAITPEPTTTSTTSGTDTCQYALDGACDEPIDCPPGTDTTDCTI
jgi:hypothetical protein